MAPTEHAGDAGASASAGVQSIQRAMSVLRLVACGMEHGVRISDIAAMSGLSHSTVHRLLKVLVQESAVEQDPQTRRYRIGPEMSLLGLARTNRFPIKTIAQPYLNALVEQIGDVAFLSVRHGADSVCIGRTLGHHAIQVLSIEEGARRPLGASVSGVVLLSGMEQDLSERITQSNAVRLERSGCRATAVLDKVRAARQAGFVYAEDGVMPGTSAVAVPVRDPRGQVVAAISVAALNARLDRKRMPAVRSCMLEQSSMITRRLAQLEKARPRQA